MYAACAGATDADCAIWDHVVQLFVCCDGGEPSSSSGGGGGGGGAQRPCDTCDSTVWLAAHHPGTLSLTLKTLKAPYGWRRTTRVPVP